MGKVGYTCVLTVGGADPVGKAIDVELTASSSEVDITTRDSAGWREYLMGHKDWTISIDQLWIPSDDGLKTLRAAWISGNEIAMTMYDEDSSGFSGQCFVSGMNFGQPLDGAVVLPITLRGTAALIPIEGGS